MIIQDKVEIIMRQVGAEILILDLTPQQTMMRVKTVFEMAVTGIAKEVTIVELTTALTGITRHLRCRTVEVVTIRRIQKERKESEYRISVLVASYFVNI